MNKPSLLKLLCDKLSTLNLIGWIEQICENTNRQNVDELQKKLQTAMRVHSTDKLLQTLQMQKDCAMCYKYKNHT